MSRIPPRLLVACLVVVSTAAPVVGVGSESADDGPPDPPTDVIGWENGYWHNESVAVDQTDGLNETELDAMAARSMARVEYLREVEFESDVPVEVVSTETYRERYDFQAGGSELTAEWKNVRYEALLLVGEDRNATAVERQTLGASIGGFYSSSDDRIVLVSPGDGRPTVDPATLVHEFVHAVQEQRYGDLQDQRTNRSGSRYDPATWDGERAAEGIVEGEANYVEALYRERCDDEWSCVPVPREDRSQYDRHRGVLMAHYFPYSDGPPYVHHLRSEGGWEAVDAAHRDPPASSEQVIHRTDEPPTDLAYEDRARGGWSRFEAIDGGGITTLGESAMYTMFWHRAKQDFGTWVSLSDFERPDAEPYDVYDYNASPTEGWGDDVLVPYRRQTSGGPEHGYVWVTEWDSQSDAREFETTYVEMLSEQDVEARGAGLFVVPEGPFEDAFRVVRNGTRVTVVNAPTTDAVEELRPGLRPPEGQTSEANATSTTESTPSTGDSNATRKAADSGTDAASRTTAGGPTSEAPSGSIPTDGFGVLPAVFALVALGGFLRRRS